MGIGLNGAGRLGRGLHLWLKFQSALLDPLLSAGQVQVDPSGQQKLTPLGGLQRSSSHRIFKTFRIYTSLFGAMGNIDSYHCPLEAKGGNFLRAAKFRRAHGLLLPSVGQDNRN